MNLRLTEGCCLSTFLGAQEIKGGGLGAEIFHETLFMV